MFIEEQILVDRLLAWYDDSARILPWRKSNNPYHIWISEIMLQQTQVATVIPYFERFIQALPNIEALAEISQEKLNKLWEGLGYYSRARNLKKAAMMICSKWEGHLPESYDELCTLPGIGPYTSGAIASIAFGQRVPAVDGNVFRILSRLYADDMPINISQSRKHYTQIADKLIPLHRPGDFNQALMDLGAVICLANKKPLCESCPIQELCYAHKNNQSTIFPIKVKKKVRRVENRIVLILLHDKQVHLVQRPQKGLLSGLWEFPNYLQPFQLSDFISEYNLSIENIEDWGPSHHLFTHIRWNMHGYAIKLKAHPLNLPGHWCDRQNLIDSYAIPKALRVYQEKLLQNDSF